MQQLFSKQIAVNSAAPLPHALPVVEAVAAEISRIRETSLNPILVISGERHDAPHQVLMPYTFMLANDLLSDNPDPPAWARSLKISYESSHNALELALDMQLGKRFERDKALQLQERDNSGYYFLEASKTVKVVAAPTARHFLFAAMQHVGVPVRPTDTAHYDVKDYPTGVFNKNDPLTRRFMQQAGITSVTALSTSGGMAVRNKLAAHLIRERLGESDLVWHQGGVSHVMGSRGLYDYEDSLAGLFNPLVKRGQLHVIAVVPQVEGLQVPKAAFRFAGTVITYRGLDDHAADMHEEYDLTSRVIVGLHAVRGVPCIVPAPELPTDEVYEQRRAHFTDTLYPAWIAGLPPVPKEEAPPARRGFWSFLKP